MSKQSGRIHVIAAALIAMSLVPVGVRADIAVKDLSAVISSASVGGEMFMLWRSDNSAFFNDDENYRWGEGHTKLHTTIGLGPDVDMNFGIVYKWTAGTDFYSSSMFMPMWDDGLGTADSSDFAVDTAFVRFNTLFGLPVTATLGKQYYELEKQFLCGSGTKNTDAAIWLNSERAFPLALRMDLDMRPALVTLFAGRMDTSDDLAAELYGESLNLYNINFHYSPRQSWAVYAGYLQQQDTDTGKITGSFRDNTGAVYLGGELTWKGIFLEGEYVREFGTIDNPVAEDIDRDAWGGFVSCRYTMEDVPGMPYVQGSVFAFSGDDDATSDNESFYPFHYGFTDFGRFFLGEIIGEQQLFNTNFLCCKAEAGGIPMGGIALRGIYFHFELMEEDSLSVTDKDYGDEVNLLAEFPLFSDTVFAGVLAGAAWPGKAAEQLWGSDDTSYVVMSYVTVGF